MNNTARIPIFLMMMFVLCITFPTSIVAQPLKLKEDGRRERIEQLKKLKLIEALNLDEEQAVRFFAKYHKYEQLLLELNKKRNDIIDDIQASLRGGSTAEPDKLIAEVIDTERQIYETKKNFLEEVRDVLSPKQIGQLIVFERRFRQELQRIVEDVWRERQLKPQR